MNVKLPVFFGLTACNKLISADIATRIIDLMQISFDADSKNLYYFDECQVIQ